MSDEFWTMFNTPKRRSKPLKVSALVQDNVYSDDQKDHEQGDHKELGKREKEIIYRGKMGNLFKELNDLIPSYRKCSNSRLSVLEKSITFIKRLKSESNVIKEENMQLKEENQRLKQAMNGQSLARTLESSPSSLL